MPRFIIHPDTPAPKSGPWQSLSISQAIHRMLTERSITLRPKTIALWKSVAKKFHAILPIRIRNLNKSDLHRKLTSSLPERSDFSRTGRFFSGSAFRRELPKPAFRNCGRGIKCCILFATLVH